MTAKKRATKPAKARQKGGQNAQGAREGAAGRPPFVLEHLPPTSLVPAPYNPRTISPAARARMANGIRRFGFVEPIVARAEDRLVVGGHQRLQFALEEGYDVVPVALVPGLSDREAAALNVLLNNPNAQGEFDLGKLTELLSTLDGEGFDASLTGFDEAQLESLLAPASRLIDETDLDHAPPLPKVATTRTGDLILLGQHRLVCGDSRDPAVWAMLLDGKKADAVWTDPPYNVAYTGSGKAKRKAIANDNLSDEDFRALLEAVFDRVLEHVAPGGAVYVAAPSGPPFHDFGGVLRRRGLWRQTLTWVKNQLALGHSDYHYRHEVVFEGNRPVTDTFEAEDAGLIAYGWNPSGPHRWVGGRSRHTVFEVAKPRESKDHPTMKPVDLIRPMLEASTLPGQSVVDAFGGSGSTLITCEAISRRARLIELDPLYCDVIVRRWEEGTGLKAVRPKHGRGNG